MKFKPEDFKCKDCFGYCSCVQGGEYIARLANARIPFILEEAKKQWMKELLAEAPGYKLCMDLNLTPSDLFHRIGELKQENAALRAELEATKKAKAENDERFQLEAAALRSDLREAKELNEFMNDKIERLRSLLREAREMISSHEQLCGCQEQEECIKRIDAALGEKK